MEAGAIAAIGAAVAVIGLGVTTYKMVQDQSNASEAAKAESQLRQTEADNVREAAAYEEKQFRRRMSFMMGERESEFAASGLDPAGKSAIFAELDNVKQVELEALNIRRTGEVSASGREFESKLARQRSSIFENQIGPTIGGGFAKAGSTILSSWSSFNKASKISVWDGS